MESFFSFILDKGGLQQKLFSSCELDKIFQSRYFVDHLWMSASVWWNQEYLTSRQARLEQGTAQVRVKRQQNAAVLKKSVFIFHQFKKKEFLKKSIGDLASSPSFLNLQWWSASDSGIEF